MTLDVHHPSPAYVDPLGEGLSARRCRRRASDRDKSHQFHDDVFHGCCLSPSIHLLDVRQLPQISPSHFLLGEAQELWCKSTVRAADSNRSVAVAMSALPLKA